MSSATSKIGAGRPGALPPAFSSRDGCRAWLDAQTHSDARRLLTELERQLGRLNGHKLAVAVRFAILELLRQPVHAALSENRREYADRPLPLRPVEQEALEAALATWNALSGGYLLCVEACRDPGTEGQLATAAQRALATLAELQLDCYRSSHDVAEGHWLRVHRAFGAAEDAGAAMEPVTDALRLGRSATTAFAAWSECLLLQLANLQELPARQVDCVARWARRWSGKLEPLKDAAAGGRAVPLHVDVGSDRPAGYRPNRASAGRSLDTAQLKRSLKKRILALDGGQTPEEIGIGKDCEPHLVRELLVQTYARWCKGGATRRHERRGAEGSCAVVGGLEAAHFHISGGMAAERPERTLSDGDIRRQREELAVFGRILATGGGPGGRSDGDPRLRAALESWRLLDQSPTGLRLLRAADQPGQRFTGKQLVAVRTPDMRNLHLGTVRRASIDGEGALHAGVRIFAGEPVPVMVRGTGVNAMRSKAVPAFFLPDIAALGEPATVILPSGWYKRERVLEVLPGDIGNIRLTGLVERGSDYERASFETQPAAPGGAQA